jgi:secreted PhoX family phosphatase
VLSSLSQGLEARTLIQAGDRQTDGLAFPMQNDLTAYFPLPGGEAYLLVGHELPWGRDGLGGRFTRLRLKGGQVVESQLWTSGMHNNCAGTVTPWNTVLSGEEYPHRAVKGDPDAKLYTTKRIAPSDPAASFGWIYEFSPYGETPAGQMARRTALGRYSHESALVVGDREVYLTEDFDGGFFYRFVADRPRDLSSGKLYAYDRPGRRWLPIKDVYNAHIEAKEAGATPFIRLEDVRQGPDGMIYVAETGALRPGEEYGRVFRLDPRTQAMDVFLEGDGKGMAQPDNLIFDREGRLIICEDQYEANIKAHGPNEVLRVEANKSLTRLLSVLPEGEPTGPSFSPDGKTMFLSVMAGPKSAVVVIDGF